MSRLSEIARHVVSPEGIVSTGWPAVREDGVVVRPLAGRARQADPGQEQPGQVRRRPVRHVGSEAERQDLSAGCDDVRDVCSGQDDCYLDCAPDEDGGGDV